MNLLVVAEGRYPDFVDGAETVIRYVNRELLARGHVVYSLTRKDLPDFDFALDVVGDTRDESRYKDRMKALVGITA